MIVKSGHSARRIRSCEDGCGPDRPDRAAVAMHLDFVDYADELPRHQHRQGQLVLALHGAVTWPGAAEFGVFGLKGCKPMVFGLEHAMPLPPAGILVTAEVPHAVAEPRGR